MEPELADRDEAARLNALARRLSSRLIRSTGREISTAFEEALAEIAGILGVDRGTVVELSPSGSPVETVHAWARPGVAPFDPSADLPRLRELLDRMQPETAGSPLPPD